MPIICIYITSGSPFVQDLLKFVLRRRQPDLCKRVNKSARAGNIFVRRAGDEFVQKS